MYDYLDEFRYLNWSSLCSGETGIQLKIVEPNNLLSLVLKLGESVCSKCKYHFCVRFTFKLKHWLHRYVISECTTLCTDSVKSCFFLEKIIASNKSDVLHNMPKLNNFHEYKINRAVLKGHNPYYLKIFGLIFFLHP